jgi:hypothetical protein
MPCLKHVLLLSFVLLIPASFALEAPVVSSPTHPENEWSRYEPLFSWQEINQAIRYCYVLDDQPGTEAPDFDPSNPEENCTEFTQVQLPKKLLSGDYYFHVKAISSTAKSPTTTYRIKMDIEAPSRPELSAAPTSDGKIKLTWVESEDDASGVKEYEVYRKLMGGFTPRDTPLYATVPAPADSFFDANNLDQSTTYHYIIRAIDNAGNVGVTSPEAHAATMAKCDLDIAFSVGYSSDKSKLELSVESRDNGETNYSIYHGSLKAELPDGSEKVFFQDSNPFTSWSDELDLSDIEEGIISFSLIAREFFGDDCSQEKSFVFDVTEPEASFSFPKYNDRVSETVSLELAVDDKGSFKSGIESVEFFVKDKGSWLRIGAGEEAGSGLFTADWDTFSVENGKHDLKAEVLDAGGNQAQATTAVNVLNAFESSVDLNTAFENALESRKGAFAEKWLLEGKAVFSESQAGLIELADSNIAEARRLSGLGGVENETNAKMMIAQAILLYDQSKSIVSTADYKSSDFIFNKEQVDLLLNAAGFSGQAAAEAKAFIEKADPQRKLQLVRVDDDNTTYYRALIVVSFSIDTNILADSNQGQDVVKVIEVIPKEFAEYSSEIDSNISFEVLKEDPSISFTLTRDDYKNKEIVYALRQNLTEQQADALIEDNIVNKFVAPPIMLPASSPALLGSGLSMELLMFVGVGLLAVVIVLVLVIVLKSRIGRSKAGSSQGKFSAKPEPKAAKKGKAGFPKIKVPKFRKKEESPLSVFGKK